MLHVVNMLRTSCRRSLLRSPSVSVSVAKLESGIPSMNDIKKSDDYHSSKYTILGSKRKDPMLYTDRKVGRGYWHFSNTIFHSWPKIHPKSAKGIKQNFCIIFFLLLVMCIDYNWFGYQIKKFTANFCSKAGDYNLQKIKSMNTYRNEQTVLNNMDSNDN
ncbi:Calcium uptake protein [Dirofilaria immitis]